MKLAYVTTYNSDDLHAWSGTGYFILAALRNAGIEAVSIGELKYGGDMHLSKLKDIFYRKFRNKSYLRDRDPAVLNYYASQVEKRIQQINPDIIFSPSTIPIAYLNTEKPIVFWADAAFSGMVNFYPDFCNLSESSIKHGNKMEQLALERCTLAIYSSEWAANTAATNYKVNPKKIKVVPFGANIMMEKSTHEVRNIIINKKTNICNLLFIGVDWYRKGGDIALEAARLLNKEGLRTNLHVVGCTPPIATIPPYMKCYGYISKKTMEGLQQINRLLSQSHFLILPSRAECYGIVFAEASSFGLPSLAANVGGVSTAIHNGRNGWTFPPNGSPEQYCNYILSLMSTPDAYKELSYSSHLEYKCRLNWKTSGQRVLQLMSQYCNI